MGRKIRPCDCKDQATADMLNEQGIAHIDDSISVQPNSVVLKMGHTTVKIPMSRFKAFAEWYLTEQDTEERKKPTFKEYIVIERSEVFLMDSIVQFNIMKDEDLPKFFSDLYYDWKILYGEK